MIISMIVFSGLGPRRVSERAFWFSGRGWAVFFEFGGLGGSRSGHFGSRGEAEEAEGLRRLRGEAEEAHEAWGEEAQGRG